jgi:hypothetical protein
MQFTQYDQMGFYILSHFYLYGTYVQPLTHAGANRDYWQHMSREILNSMISTPLLQSFFEFINKHKDTVDMLGFDLQDLIQDMKNKFTSELHSLYNLMIAMPVKMNVAGQQLAYRMDQAYMLLSDYLMKSHQHDFVKQVRSYMGGLEQQMNAVTGIRIGGRIIKHSKKERFVFTPRKISNADL